MYFELERTGRILEDLKEQIRHCPQMVEPIFWAEGKVRPEKWQTFSRYQLWGGYDKWAWFRMTVTVPAEFDGFPVWFEVQTGRGPEQWDALNPQFLAYVNGEMIQGMDVNHTGFLLTGRAAAGDVYEIELAAYSGTAKPAACYGCSDEKQTPPRLELIPTVCRHDMETERLYYNLKAAMDSAALYGKDEKLRIDIQNYLTTAVNMLDMRVPESAEYAESVQWANDYLETEFYGGYCGRTEAAANCIGHTHIDVAWLWTLEQTEQKAVRSFATVLNLMKEYPEYLFMSSQPQLYQYVKKNAPELYEQIKARVKEGRWEAEGAMWLEADCNLSSGESLVRQIMHGKQFFQDEFGVDSRILWLPDVFGYSAALPQILEKSGIDSFVTSKISWNEYNHMPFDTFQWQGIDGTELFTQFINMGDLGMPGEWFSTYNGQMQPEPLKAGWDMYQQKQISNETLVSFGFGDGGGGPTREMLEMYRRLEKGIPGVPKTRMSTVSDTLDRIRKKAEESGRMPKWVGELYLEYHRGTYTSMARNKNYNRRCEYLLQNAEALSMTASQLLAHPYPKEGLHDCWETVLFNQFHDIIPGSSIEAVYEDSKAQYEQVLSTGGGYLRHALSAVADQVCEDGILVYNPTSFVQSGPVESDGKALYASEVPPHGWKVLSGSESAGDAVQVSETCVENAFFRLEFDENMNLSSIYDKRCRREVLKPGGRGNVLTAYEDKPHNYDAWEIKIYYTEKQWEIDETESVTVIADNGVNGGVEIHRRFLDSVIVQRIMLYRDLDRIDFDTWIDWKQDHILLKTAFEVDVLSDYATYEIQYGNVRRATHQNTSWDAAKFESCAHKWADLSEDGYGVAILNDCKYGHAIHDGVIRLSLLKSATYPNPSADKEEHRFTYSLMPHAGDFREAGVVKAAYALNNPLCISPASGGGNLPGEFSFAQTDCENVVIEVLKQAEKGEELILRLYEAYGRRSRVAVTLFKPAAAVWETDLLENKETERTPEGNRFAFEIRPFEIKTFAIKF